MKAHLRALLRGIVATLLDAKSEPADLDRFASVLVVAPHPDDETFGCGGLIRLSASADKSVTIVFVTDGAASHPGHPTVPAEAVRAIRRGEAVKATSALGIPEKSLLFLDEADGTMAHLNPEGLDRLTTRLTVLFSELKPSLILVPSAQDGSSEHEAISRICAGARRAGAPSAAMMDYYVWAWWSPRLLLRIARSPGVFLKLELGGAASAKLGAAKSYKSQSEPLPPQDQPALPHGFVDAFTHDKEYFRLHTDP